MNRKHCIALVLSAVIATACQPEGPPPAAAPQPQAQAPQSAPANPVQTSANGMLTVDPAVIDLCKEADGSMAAKVSWNASSAGTEGVEVWLQAPGEEKKMWSADGAVSSAETGRWLRDGSVVTLVNGEDKQELASIRITARPCVQ